MKIKKIRAAIAEKLDRAAALEAQAAQCDTEAEMLVQTGNPDDEKAVQRVTQNRTKAAMLRQQALSMTKSMGELLPEARIAWGESRAESNRRIAASEELERTRLKGALKNFWPGGLPPEAEHFILHAQTARQQEVSMASNGGHLSWRVYPQSFEGPDEDVLDALDFAVAVAERLDALKA